MSRFYREGGALVLVLVTMGVFLVLMISGLGLITTQKHALTNQVQAEQAFHAAEAGSEYALWLLGSNICTAEELLSQSPLAKEVVSTTGQRIGAYQLAFSKEGPNPLSVTSLGKGTSRLTSCQQLNTTLTRTTTAYEQRWQHVGGATCGPFILKEPVCQGKPQPTPTISPQPTPTPPLACEGTLFVGTDNEEIVGLPLRLGKFLVNGANVVSGGALPITYPLNGIVAVGNELIVGEPHKNMLRRIDFNGNLLGSETADVAVSCCNEDMAYDARDPNQPIIWHVSAYNGIRKIDPATLDVIETIPPNATITNVLGVTIIGNDVWMSVSNQGAVGKWDDVAKNFVPVFKPTGLTAAIAYDAANDVLWVGDAQARRVVPYRLDGTKINDGFLPFGLDAAGPIDGLEFVALCT